MSNNYLFYISQNYSFEILRPLQTAIIARGDQCVWFVEGDKINLDNFVKEETVLDTISGIINYNPVAVIVPGNQATKFFT